ncbi:MAG TPA: hypothetical protein VGA37_00185 [Gemmatimonadales bacterium]
MIAAACGDLLSPTATVAFEELVVLAQRPGAPTPPDVTFWVRNGGETVQALRHPDPFGTVFAEVSFPVGSLASLNGEPISSVDSVRVTISATTGIYEISLSPSGLAFAPGALPTAVFSYSLYGDLSVADGMATFDNRQAYAGALAVWEEVTVGQWRIARGSTAPRIDEIEARVVAPGTFLVAAVR